MKIFNLGREALEYVKGVLGYDNNFSRSILNAFEDSSVANIFTYLSDDMAIEKIDFNCGCVNKGGVEFLSNYILSQYGHLGYLIAIDDVMADSSENFEIENNYHHIFLDGEVFHLQWLLSTNGCELKKTIRATRVSWHFICVIYRFGDTFDLNSINDISMLDDLNGELIEIVCGAFDGDGFVHVLFEKRNNE